MRHSYATNEPFLYFYVYVKMMFWFDIDHVIQHSLPCKLLYHIVYIILSCPSLPFVKLYCILFYKTFDEQSISKKMSLPTFNLSFSSSILCLTLDMSLIFFSACWSCDSSSASSSLESSTNSSNCAWTSSCLWRMQIILWLMQQKLLTDTYFAYLSIWFLEVCHQKYLF